MVAVAVVDTTVVVAVVTAEAVEVALGLPQPVVRVPQIQLLSTRVMVKLPLVILKRFVQVLEYQL
jgi:hypothetical protein